MTQVATLLSQTTSLASAHPLPAAHPVPGAEATCGAASPEWMLWWRLGRLRGLRMAGKLALLKHFGSIQALFGAAPASLAGLAGESAAGQLLLPDEACQHQLASMQAWLDQSPRHHLLCLGDPDYPQGLLDLADPPLLLFASGELSLLHRPGLAVVGSRSATPQGIENARAFARAAGQAGLTIVSGLALGIDAAAHAGALQAGAATLALIGTGIDRLYPAANRDLALQIREHGLILSELPLGAAALQHHFPRRNRLIAALSRGVLVVEAARQSGSLITARLAADLGREVFAIPGSIHSPVSKGCHLLIRQGAKLVECAQDITEELAPVLAVRPIPEAPARAATQAPAHEIRDDPVWQALGHEPSSLAQILARCQLPMAAVQERLLRLELDRRLSRLDDGRLLRIVEAS